MKTRNLAKIKYKGFIAGKSMAILLTGATALLFTACGGGGSAGDGGDGGNIPPSPPPAQYIKGGTASSPSQISLDIDNLISEDTFTNYFKFSGVEDDKLIINASLNREITRSESLNCSASASSFIEIYDENLEQYSQFRTCNKELTVELPVDGTYIIHFNYRDNDGIARVSSIKP
jgi:hypothetical protein